MKICKLELHPEKTKIVYCKDKGRTAEYECTEFDFLGYTFRRVLIKDKLGRLQFSFLASVSKKGLDCVQRRLIRWAMCKYKHFRGHRQRAEKWLDQIKKREPKIFAHWVLS